MHRTFSRHLTVKLVSFLFFQFVAVHIAFSQSISKRYAIVIGVKNYTHVDKLQNTVNDARDMAGVLREKGFQVIEVYDPKSKRELQDKIREYFSLIKGRKDAAGLVFYSGHGMQVDGINYLIPADANPEIKADLDDQCLSMDYIMAAIAEAGNPLNIFILDACRNNPFRSFYRSNEKGLSVVTSPRGSYIVYATKPGSVASDGSGKNGLFTSKLLKYINESGLNIEQVFKRVAADVSTSSADAQRPWIASDYTGDFFFSGEKSVPGETFSHARQVKSIVQEGFSNNDRQWFSENTRDYRFEVVDGKYIMESKKGGSWISSLPLELNVSRDFEISATIRKRDGTDGYYFGLMLGYDPKTYFFHFAGITGWGNFVFADKGPQPADVIPSSTNAIVNPGNATNHIRVLKEKETIRLYINDRLMGETPFKGFYGSFFGFRIWSGNEALLLEVDDLVVREFF